MRNKETISCRQIFYILTMLLAGVYSINMPRTLVIEAGTDGMWAIIVGMLGLVIAAYLGNNLSMKYPDQTIIEYSQMIFGKGVGKLIGFILCCHFILLSALYLRNYTELVIAVLLPDTPRWILLMVSIGVIWLIINNGLEDIARLTELLAPLLLVGFLVLFFGNIGDMKFIRLLPMGQSEPIKFAQAVVKILSFGAVTGIVAMLYPYANQPQKLRKTILWSQFTGMGITLLLFISTLTIFGVQETSRIMFPVVELSRMLSFGEFLERAEALFLTLWLSISFINGSILGYCSIKGISQIVSKEKSKGFNLFILLIIFIISTIPDGQQDLSICNIIQLRYAFYLVFGITGLLWIGSIFEQKRRANHG